MAIYIQSNLLTSGDFIRTTRRYSSPQSLSKARKRGTQHVVTIGRMHFVHAMPDKVAELYSVKSWERMPVLPRDHLPAGLTPLSKISKKIKLGETVILGWALLNRMDAYWIAGHFFAHQYAVEEIAHGEQKRLHSFTKPPKVRKKRRYL